jgi:hypothetical protein
MTLFFRRGPLLPLPALLLALLPSISGAAQKAADLSPEKRALLMEAVRICQPDIERHCAGVQRGEGRIALCLAAHRTEVTPACLEAMKAARD